MNFWKSTYNSLKNNDKVVLMVVVESIGSSPGRQGFKMLVDANNTLVGSIGGGVMEFALAEEAKALLKKNTEHIYLKRQIHRGVKTEGSGMICSGEQTVAFIPLNSKDLPLLNQLLNDAKGVLSISPKGLSYELSIKLNSKFEFNKTNDANWIYKEQMTLKPKLYIIGAGHVGATTATLCQQVGFEVVLYDNRKGLNTFEAVKGIAHKQIIDYNNIADFIEEGAHIYVAIMTHGYKDDKIALEPLLGKQFKFLGVLGSLAKLKVMFEVLKKEGFEQNILDTIHAPLGLFIKSETPEEIAVSIAAQLIKVKNTA